ncbi:Metal tolerance protein C4 [Platanthera guangdongensis]|uniref:Metal tolerance protein C4 n=1 Tax=Platanthera guangdongensis TaxID=2320717 RepID=A0ABR2MN81_9ASPA
MCSTGKNNKTKKCLGLHALFVSMYAWSAWIERASRAPIQQKETKLQWLVSSLRKVALSSVHRMESEHVVADVLRRNRERECCRGRFDWRLWGFARENLGKWFEILWWQQMVEENSGAQVAVFLIQRNRHALIGRAIDDHDMERVLQYLKSDPVVDALYDCKSEVIGPGFFRFKAEIDFNGVVVVQNYLKRTGHEEWARKKGDIDERRNQKGRSPPSPRSVARKEGLLREGLVDALGSEVDRLETEIQKIVPGIRHVDIEAHNPSEPL